MIIKNNLNTNLIINKLEDLKKLKSFMGVNNIKINKSQIARELGVDSRTVSKYIDGYTKPTTRNKPSKIDEFYPLIKELLSNESIQI